MKKIVGLKNVVVKSDGTPYVKMVDNVPTDKSTLVKDTIADFIDNYGLPPDATPKDMSTFKRIMELATVMRGILVNELELEDADYETLKMVCHKMQHIKVARVVVQVMDVIDNPVKIEKSKKKKKGKSDRPKKKK